MYWLPYIPLPLIIYALSAGPVLFAVSRDWLPWWAMVAMFILYLPLQLFLWHALDADAAADPTFQSYELYLGLFE